MQEDQEEVVSCHNTSQDWNPQKYYKISCENHMFSGVFHKT